MLRELHDRARDFIRGSEKLRFFAKSLRHPFAFVIGYLYGSYLTIRYVDQYKKFPAIIFQTAIIKIGISKGYGSRLTINSKLIIEPLSIRRTPSAIILGRDAKITIADDFFIGDDVQIVAHENATITIAGKKVEASGVSAKSLIHARNKISIGSDVIIAQDTYLTDSDWHPIEGSPIQQDLIIGDHVWIATGARLLKGSEIGNNCIIACGAIVTGKAFDDHSLIAGVPAKVVKSNIRHWRREP
jgi:acetyltransferase-like isoleucine patch superfamily enzyme